MTDKINKNIHDDDLSVARWARLARKELPDGSPPAAQERNWSLLNRRLARGKTFRVWRWGGLAVLLAGGALAMWRLPMKPKGQASVENPYRHQVFMPVGPGAAPVRFSNNTAAGLNDDLGPTARGFTVNGTKIIDPQGSPLVIKGVNVNGPNGAWSRDVTRDAESIAYTWKLNLVRAMTRIAPRPGRPPSSNNSPDKLVEAFTSRGVVVLFAPSDHIGRYYSEHSTPSLNDLVDWHRTMAEKYRDNPYVWFEVQGAPGDCTLTSEWLTSHRQVIAAIRDEAKAQNVIVAHAATWGGDDGCAQGVSLFDRSAILTHGRSLLAFDGRSYGNIAFAFSVLWPQSSTRMQEYLDQVEAQGLAIFVAQFGGRFYAGKDIETAVDAIFNVAVPRQIGRVAFSWFDGHGGQDHSNALTTAGNGTTGAAVNDNDAPTNLSWLGKRVWADTHRADGL